MQGHGESKWGQRADESKKKWRRDIVTGTNELEPKAERSVKPEGKEKGEGSICKEQIRKRQIKVEG